MNKPPPPAHELLARITRTAAALEQAVARAVEHESGLTLAQLTFLRHVAAAGGSLPLGSVACRMECAKSNATQLADRLEAQDLIRRVPDPADGRSVRALLTPEGRTRLEAGEAVRRREAAALLAELNAREVGEVARMVSRLGELAKGSGS